MLRSPSVFIGTTSIRRSGAAALRCATTSSVWANESGLVRVPILSVSVVVMVFAPFLNFHWRVA